MLSTLGFANRHFYMPDDLLRKVENMILRFIAPVPYASFTAFCHTVGLYGITSKVRDPRFTNVAMLLATYEEVTGCTAVVQAKLEQRAGDERITIKAANSRVSHPAESWLAAHSYYLATTGATHEDTWRSRQRHRAARRGRRAGGSTTGSAERRRPTGRRRYAKKLRRKVGARTKSSTAWRRYPILCRKDTAGTSSKRT